MTLKSASTSGVKANELTTEQTDKMDFKRGADLDVVHRTESASIGPTYPGGMYWVSVPVRRGPADRQRFEAMGMRYEELSIDAHSFLSLNDGRMSLRKVPTLPLEDQWEAPMSVRTNIQYYFHSREKLAPDDVYVHDCTIRVHSSSDYRDYRSQNFVLPASCDSCLWDYQVLSCPPGTITIAMWRPLRRGHLAVGWARENGYNPTNNGLTRPFTHKPQARAEWTPDDVGEDEHPPIDPPVHDGPDWVDALAGVRITEDSR